MQTTDSGNLFKTDAQLLKESSRSLKLERTKTAGEPIKLSSKPLAMEVRGDDCWTAESGFVVRRMDLRTGKTSQLYKAHTGPVTCLAFWDIPASPKDSTPARHLMFSGSWDKSVKMWDTDTGTLLSSTTTHTDFLKTLLVLPSPTTPLLLTGSSDKQIHVLSLAPTLETLLRPTSTSSFEPLPCLKQVKTHTRPVTKLVAGDEPGRVYSSDSLGRILAWDVKAAGETVEVKEVGRLVEHKTVVTDLWVVPDEGVWTSSSDNSCAFHPSPTPTSPPAPLVLPSAHPATAIHSLLPLPHLTPPLLLTGSADEHIRVYDLSAGEGPAARLVREVEGHCAEVMSLRRWAREETESGKGRREEWVVSAGLDGTIRKWKVADMLVPLPPPVKEENEENANGGMTAEEAAELAELMSDED